MKAILLTALIFLGGCAPRTLSAITSGVGDLAKETGKAIVKDANLMDHAKDFFDKLGDLVFGEDEPVEVPTDAPSEANEGGSDEAFAGSEG